MEPKPSGSGWSARCPVHDDRSPSLSIAEADDGRILLKCHANHGCTTEAIVAALGLRMGDLFPVGIQTQRRTKAAPRRRTERRRAPNAKPPARSFPTAEAAIAAYVAQLGRTSTQYSYHDAAGELVGVVLRWDGSNGKKIRPVARIEDGRWIQGGMLAPRSLYHLPELLALKTEGKLPRVRVVEGEKCADALWALGLPATTSAHGSQSAGQTNWSPLAGFKIATSPDHDEPGELYAQNVARLTAQAGAESVALLKLSGLRPGEDVADWIAARRAEGWDDARIRNDLERLADVSEPLDLAALRAETAAMGADAQTGPVLTCMADILPSEVTWLWPERVPVGRITLLVGKPGEGKSFLTLELAAHITTGTSWPDGSDCPKGDVILLAAEDNAADTIRPRLDALGADVNRVHLLSAVRHNDGDEPHERMVRLGDIEAIETALSRHPGCKLVVVDPVGSFLGSGTDAHRDNEVREVLTPLARLAEKYGVALLIVAHRRKSSANFADDLAMGSVGFTGVARAVWHVSRDPEHPERRLLLPGKNNLAAQGHGLAFAIRGEPPRIEWEAGPVKMSADDALAMEQDGRRSRPGPPADAQAKAVAWLRLELANGPRLAKELEDDWIHGQCGSKRTLERARQTLGVRGFRHERRGAWWCELPVKDARLAKLEELGGLGGLKKNTEELIGSDSVDVHNAKFPQPGDVAGGPEEEPPRPVWPAACATVNGHATGTGAPELQVDGEWGEV